MRIATNSIAVWREEVCRHVLAIDFKSTADGPFRGSLIAYLDANGVRISQIGHTPGYSFRDANLAKDGTNTIAMLFASGGDLQVSQRGSDVFLGKGQATLLRNCEPGRVALRHQFEYVVVLIPSEAFKQADAIDAFTAKRIPSSSALTLVRSYVGSLKRSDDQIDDALAQIASAHLLELIPLAVSRATQHATAVEAGNVADARLRVALDMIGKRHREPDISEEAIAASQGISARYLQKLLERRGITFSSYVNELRLQTAFAALTKPDTPFTTVTDVAFSCGFRDLSYFHRLFRRRFGDTPSTVRIEAVRSWK